MASRHSMTSPPDTDRPAEGRELEEKRRARVQSKSVSLPRSRQVGHSEDEAAEGPHEELLATIEVLADKRGQLREFFSEAVLAKTVYIHLSDYIVTVEKARGLLRDNRLTPEAFEVCSQRIRHLTEHFQDEWTKEQRSLYWKMLRSLFSARYATTAEDTIDNDGVEDLEDRPLDMKLAMLARGLSSLELLAHGIETENLMEQRDDVSGHTSVATQSRRTTKTPAADDASYMEQHHAAMTDRIAFLQRLLRGEDRGNELDSPILGVVGPTGFEVPKLKKAGTQLETLIVTASDKMREELRRKSAAASSERPHTSAQPYSPHVGFLGDLNAPDGNDSRMLTTPRGREMAQRIDELAHMHAMGEPDEFSSDSDLSTPRPGRRVRLVEEMDQGDGEPHTETGRQEMRRCFSVEGLRNKKVLSRRMSTLPVSKRLRCKYHAVRHTGKGSYSSLDEVAASRKQDADYADSLWRVDHHENRRQVPPLDLRSIHLRPHAPAKQPAVEAASAATAAAAAAAAAVAAVATAAREASPHPPLQESRQYCGMNLASCMVLFTSCWSRPGKPQNERPGADAPASGGAGLLPVASRELQSTGAAAGLMDVTRAPEISKDRQPLRDETRDGRHRLV
ncbi:unnamed protein product [Vitrella brassicaformis CCMP3155]|uniref:Uncharacterized protein n=2 Tax=Vitrella brassicaformis TaxID=1169539 RepID=A0A0G4EC96_VITBC|nr:unnamed protein product [Vitrella brassicaformis CCMP3155]|eukprot:CEL92964.1 unnamed protein product [Vitrella brassicaformis CCMP3155]